MIYNVAYFKAAPVATEIENENEAENVLLLPLCYTATHVATTALSLMHNKMMYGEILVFNVLLKFWTLDLFFSHRNMIFIDAVLRTFELS